MIYFGIDPACTQLYSLYKFCRVEQRLQPNQTVMLSLSTTWSFHRDSASILSTILLNQKHCSQNASSTQIPPTLLWISLYSQQYIFLHLSQVQTLQALPCTDFTRKYRHYRNMRFRLVGGFLFCFFSLVLPTSSITVANCRTVVTTWPTEAGGVFGYLVWDAKPTSILKG